MLRAHALKYRTISFVYEMLNADERGTPRKAAADRLAPVLPRAAAVNELSDALITID